MKFTATAAVESGMPDDAASSVSHGNNIDTLIDVFANQIQIDSEEITQNDIDCMFVIPTPKCTHCTNLAPIVLLKARSVNGQLCGHPFICLLDSDSTSCLHNKFSLSFGT